MPTTPQQLYERSVDQVRRGDVRAALNTLLDTVAADPGHVGALDAAGRICRMLGAVDDAGLFEELARRPDEAQPLFDLAFRMVDQGRADVAVPLLEKCRRAAPDSPGVRRELAFARMQHQDFAGSRKALAPLLDDPALAETERLDVHLLAAEAAAYAGDRDAARELLAEAESMPADEDQLQRLDALHALLGRSLHWDSLSGLGLREWHFIQHAGLILKVAGGYFEDNSLGGRFGLLELRGDMVAFLLQRLAHLLQTYDLVPEVCVPASDTAAPLAHALAQRLGADVAASLPDAAGRPTLLVAASAGELQPFVAGLARHRADLRVFALNLEWERDAVLCPEIVGVLARRVLLPWEARYAFDAEPAALRAGAEPPKALRELPADARPPAELGAELVAAMDALPDDGGRSRAEFEGIYRPLRHELLLGHEQEHPHRRRFTRLSPCRLTPGARPQANGNPPSGPDSPDDEGWHEPLD